MANEAMATDPLGNQIHLISTSLPSGDSPNYEIYDDVSLVIKKPAMLVEIIKDDNKEMYYFRSMGWEYTLLIKVEFLNDRWETTKWTKNPTNGELSRLLKVGKQII